MINILYISIIGMNEPLGKSQVLEYLKGLSTDHSISLHTFEKNITKAEELEINEIMNTYGINWTYQKYSNRFGVISTSFQIFSSFFKLRHYIHNNSIDIVHARSQIPAVIALLLKQVSKVKVIFDIRGFQIDEKAEIGRIKKDSFFYKTLKYIEKISYQRSDAIVSLTHSARDIIGTLTDIEKVSVIPTCASNAVFKVENNDKLKRDLGYSQNDKIIIHVGTVGNWYDFDSELLLIKEIFKQNDDFKFLVLNKSEKDLIYEKLNTHKICKERVKVSSTDFYNVYKYLNIADFSLFIIKPTYSKIASAPTKFAENLCCELFTVTNNNIGDMNKFITEYPDVGFSFDISEISTDIEVLAKKIIQVVEQRPKSTDQFQLLYEAHMTNDIALKRYREVYKKLYNSGVSQ